MTSVVEETTSGSVGTDVVGEAAGEGGLSAQELLAQVLDDKTMAALAARARESGLALLGEGGLMQQLVKRFLEASLEGEMDAHLGYAALGT